MTVLQVAREHYSNRIQSSFAFCLLEKKFCLLLVGEGFFLHYYTNTIHILHMSFTLSKCLSLLEIRSSQRDQSSSAAELILWTVNVI
jgi:hypothetical protein